MSKLLLCGLVTLLFSISWGYLALNLLRREGAKQAILEYVDNHKSKSGTPTMGGIIFLIPTAIMTLLFGGIHNEFAIISVCVMLGYGLVGFLDDFIKVRHSHNQGLKAYQKIIAQGGIAVIVTAYAYMSEYVGTSVYLPFSDRLFDLGWWYLPLCFVVFIATTNSVNLTDGLDGLAGNTSLVSVIVLAVVAVAEYFAYSHGGETLMSRQLYSLAIFCVALCGGILGFLWFNTYPAKVFMGDTGSLALGGSIAIIAVFIRNPLIVLIVGIMFAISSISVIMQVVYFKLTHGKRIFLMAPLHHHLQYNGYKETKIVGFYTIITVCFGIIALLSI